MADFLVLCVFIGLFCGGLALSGWLAEFFHSFFTGENHGNESR